MKIKIIAPLAFFFIFNIAHSQGNNLTSSPYSLFGLGKINESNIGITNSLGRSGIGLGSENELNGLNPASLATIKLNTFFFDVGVKAEYNNFGDKSSSSTMPTFSVANIAFGFPLNEKSGVSLSLIPFTEVGYFFKGIVQNIDGSAGNFTSNITGSGGLNAVSLNYGRKVSRLLNVGVTAKYLFGSVKQTEIVVLGTDILSIDDSNYYGGFNFAAGIQAQITPKLNLSSVINFNSVIKGSKDRIVQKVVDEIPSQLENSIDIKIKNYQLPSEISLGIKYTFKNYYVVSDIKKSFWNVLDQKDNIGKFVDSNVFGFGIERFRTTDSYKKSATRYRIGYNYDDGNLEINNKKIGTSSYTVGIGIPFGENRKTYLNLSYSYGSKGVVSNILVKENYHTLTLNFDFADNWFLKRKYD